MRQGVQLSTHISKNVLSAVLPAMAMVVLLALQMHRNLRRQRRRSSSAYCGYADLVGNTPLAELRSLSRATGCRIFVKAEYLTPGSTSKDRVALRMIEEAEEAGKLKPGGIVVEGTSGSTGIALAALCRARGYQCLIVMPDDQAQEKLHLLRHFGAVVEVVKTAGIANPKHYYNLARTKAQELPGAVFMDQFETSANFNAHYGGTGPEIWRQLEEVGCWPDAFVMSAGTGGTIAGVSCYIKKQASGTAGRLLWWRSRRAQRRKPQVYLADPPGSSLYNKVRHGVCYTSEQQERGVRRHRYDSIAEGIGLDRITANFARAQIDGAFQVTDQEAVDMAHYILQAEGLFIGSSSAVNLVGAVRAAWELGVGQTIVTVLCDSGQRHLTRFWNQQFMEQRSGLTWPVEPPLTLDFLK